MEVELFTLCDYAADMGRGKLVIVGTFDSIVIKDFPAVHPFLSVAARVRFRANELGKHTLKVGFLDSEGTEIIPPAQGEIEARLAEGNDSTVVNLAASVGQIKLNKPGEYSVQLSIDEQIVKRSSFFAKQK